LTTGERPPRVRRPRRERIEDLRASRDRGAIELVRHRCDQLPVEEGALMEQVFLQGRTVAAVAALTGAPVRRLRLRVKRILARLARPEFDTVVNYAPEWPRPMAAVGRAVFVRGLSVRAASRQCGVPYHAAVQFARSISSLAPVVVAARRRGEAA